MVSRNITIEEAVVPAPVEEEALSIDLPVEEALSIVLPVEDDPELVDAIDHVVFTRNAPTLHAC